jgi:deubiquitinase DESI2
MGGAVSGSAVAAEGASYPVVLNVYDLTPINNYLHWCGLGIFHSAVEGEHSQSQIRLIWVDLLGRR